MKGEEKRETNEEKKSKISKNKKLVSAQQVLRQQSSRPPLEAREGTARRGCPLLPRLLRAALRNEVSLKPGKREREREREEKNVFF